jgi:hypothetical protein
MCAMRHRFLLGLLLTGALVQTGCCNMGCKTGCGPKYCGAWFDNPPCGDPCDCYGGWTGGCGGCGGCGDACNGCNPCGSPFPWMRAQKMRLGWLHSMLGCNKNNGCCDQVSCGTPCEATCEATCEAGCGVVGGGCGCENGAQMMDGGTPMNAPMIDGNLQQPLPPAPGKPVPMGMNRPTRTNSYASRSPRVIQASANMPLANNGVKCNCGRQH